jgi:two-component system response regulator RegX3
MLMPGKTLLIVEDNEIDREGMAFVLRGEGYTVLAFPDGKGALGYMSGKPPPDLILLDMVIPPPGCDGWRFLEERQKLPALASVPVIITTGLSIAGDQWAPSLGACVLLKKPVDVDPLLTAVRGCLPD